MPVRIPLQYTSIPMPGVRCPTCQGNGEEVWVIPGKNCHKCGTPCSTQAMPHASTQNRILPPYGIIQPPLRAECT
ncbi:hypothetical protein ATEIFO6365_0001090300 [Aspergillus terreus]|uniref:Uncharacterized protein n=1 Tax=Aspergillus terreus TaxID=33178 RepID=A0A5M3YQY0_ASPTE|nr:hypothetical protein ATETN484_0001082400 [Aspergillus terreus]GFF12679.1 hypothetical protein ATEIFO6365_0001090300 [Aspergillus terreus]